MTTDWYTLTVSRIRPLKWEAAADTGTTIYYLYSFTERGTAKKLKKFMSNLEKTMTANAHLDVEA